ncbi:hypothetical protein LSM04_000561 [Trypanosoma melophagium]|uniref:uncharacterized protein n=1 Tax=Trypanosoma melophagium TaxID=715481 RepID=UPI00351A81EE|nr:hypothetical protein LSM04_000561 [Trypanosoma melophagium]
MYEKERKKRKLNCVPTVISPTGPASALFICTTKKLIQKYGLSFFFLQNSSSNNSGSEKKLRCKPLDDIISPNAMDDILQRVDGATTTSTSSSSKYRQMYMRSAEAWSQRWKQSSVESQKSPILPSLPDVLITLLSDVGLADVSQPFSLIGALTPTPPDFGISESTTNSINNNNIQCRSSSSASYALQPLTSICINAINDIVERTEVVSHQAKMRCARRRLSESQFYSTQEKEGSRETVTSIKENTSSIPPLRLFLLSPYTPYTLLRKSVNQNNTTKSDIPSFYGGEACEILLVYVCSKAAARVVGLAQVNETPEVWGRIPFPQEGNIENGTSASSINSTLSSSSPLLLLQPTTVPTVASTSSPSPSPQLHANAHEELFFIAASVEDYLRLGSAFAWVYGWQLCYAAQGPPPRSLQWLKLFAPSALATVVSETV